MTNSMFSEFLSKHSISEIDRVAFFKHDDLTSDLICCELQAGIETWLFHEECDDWDKLLGQLEQLPEFKSDWQKEVMLPPFEENHTIAFERNS